MNHEVLVIVRENKHVHENAVSLIKTTHLVLEVLMEEVTLRLLVRSLILLPYQINKA